MALKIMLKKQPKVSIIIVNYNGEKFLMGLLKSLKKIRYPNYEIIIVDNASTDKSLEIIEKYSPEIKIVKNKINRGFAGGANDGINASNPDSKYVITLNADMIVDSDWITFSVNAMQSDKKIALVGNALLNPGESTLQTLGHLEVNGNLAKFRRLGVGKDIKYFFNQPIIDVDFTWGLIKKNILKKIGLFDEKNFLMYEEADLCRRIKDAGYRIVVATKAKIWHLESQSLKKTSAFRIYYSYRNRLRYILKHNRGFGKIYFGFILCGIYFYKILKFSFKGRFDCSLAILKGISWNIRNFRDYF